MKQVSALEDSVLDATFYSASPAVIYIDWLILVV